MCKTKNCTWTERVEQQLLSRLSRNASDFYGPFLSLQIYDFVNCSFCSLTVSLCAESSLNAVKFEN